MTLEEIEAKAAEFFEWPTSDKNHVTTTSAILFAKYCANTKTDLNDPQPPPIKNNLPAVWDLVIEDMKQRDLSGLEKYQTRLQPHNGRDFLIDAYQEALDLSVYLRGLIFERDRQ